MAARLSPGAISESSSSHLPPSEASKRAKPVTFPLARSSRATMPLATGSLVLTKTIGIVHQPFPIAIFFSALAASARLGTTTRSTPLLKSALI